jgi:hypothetical protein
MNTIRKLRLVLEAQLIMVGDGNPEDAQQLKGLIEVLKDVGKTT